MIMFNDNVSLYLFVKVYEDNKFTRRVKKTTPCNIIWGARNGKTWCKLYLKWPTPSEEKDILVCIITATELSCNYTGTWLDRTSQG